MRNQETKMKLILNTAVESKQFQVSQSSKNMRLKPSLVGIYGAGVKVEVKAVVVSRDFGIDWNNTVRPDIRG